MSNRSLDAVHLTLLASGSRTTTQNLDVHSLGRAGVHVIIDVTNLEGGTPSITPKIQGRDPASGKFYDLLAGTAITSVSTVVLKVFPGATAAANTVANDFVSGKFRVELTHADGQAVTYSVGCNLID